MVPRCLHSCILYQISNDQAGQGFIPCLSLVELLPIEALVSLFTIGLLVPFCVAVDVIHFFWIVPFTNFCSCCNVFAGKELYL